MPSSMDNLLCSGASIGDIPINELAGALQETSGELIQQHWIVAAILMARQAKGVRGAVKPLKGAGTAPGILTPGPAVQLFQNSTSAPTFVHISFVPPTSILEVQMLLGATSNVQSGPLSSFAVLEDRDREVILVLPGEQVWASMIADTGTVGYVNVGEANILSYYYAVRDFVKYLINLQNR